MSTQFKRFVVKTFVAAGILVLFGWMIFGFVTPGKYLSVLPWMLAFIIFITLITHAYLLRMAKKDMSRFAGGNMIISMLRLLLYSAFAFVYLYKNPEEPAVFVVCLVVCYIVFTYLAVADLSAVTKKKSE